MKKMALTMLVILSASIWVLAQNTNSNSTAKASTTNTNSNSKVASKRPPVFRASKEQISQAQSMLKQKGLYSGEVTGKLDDLTRDALRKFQEAEKIRETGTLNRITLEKMGVQLTDKQKLIPVSESSMNPDTSDSRKSRSTVFRATKDQSINT